MSTKFTVEKNSYDAFNKNIYNICLLDIDICEDLDLKQRIIDMKDEIESHRATKKRDLVRKRSQNTRRLVQLIVGALTDKHLVLGLDSFCAAEYLFINVHWFQAH